MISDNAIKSLRIELNQEGFAGARGGMLAPTRKQINSFALSQFYDKLIDTAVVFIIYALCFWVGDSDCSMSLWSQFRLFNRSVM